MKFNLKTLLSGTAALVLALGMSVPEADAAFKIRVTDTGNAQTVEDNQAGDTSPIAGSINATFNTANFQIVTTIGTSKPLGGNGNNLARVDLLNVNVTALNGGGTLTIEITDTDFQLGGPGPGGMTGSIGGTLGNSVNNTIQVNYVYDSGNAEFGAGTTLSTGTFTGPGGFSGDFGPTQVNGVNNPFSMTQIVTITMVGNDTISYDSDHMVNAVPEPTSLLLFGSGLVGLGYLARRKNQKASAK